MDSSLESQVELTEVLKVQKCLLNKFSLVESPNSKSRKLANFWEVKSTVLWLELVKSRVRPQRSKQKKKGRRRPDEPLDEHNTIDDSSLPTALWRQKEGTKLSSRP